MDCAEECQELCPGAIAVIHGVGVVFIVGTQAFEEAMDRIMAHVEIRAGHEAAVLGIEQKHHSHEDIEQAAVDIIRVLGKDLTQELTAGAFIGCLEAAQELIERIEDLSRQVGRDPALVVAALAEEPRQAHRAGGAEQPVGVQQHLQRGEDGPPADLGHGGHGEGQAAGVLALGGIDQAQVHAIDQQANGHPGIAQQPLEALAGRGHPGALVDRSAHIELGAGGQDPHQQQPRAGRGHGPGVQEGKRRSEGLPLLHGHLERVGDGPLGRQAHQTVVGPLEETPHEVHNLLDGRDLVAILAARAHLLHILQETLLQRQRVPLQEHLRINQRGRRYHQPIRLEIPQPSLVIANRRIVVRRLCHVIVARTGLCPGPRRGVVDSPDPSGMRPAPDMPGPVGGAATAGTSAPPAWAPLEVETPAGFASSRVPASAALRGAGVLLASRMPGAAQFSGGSVGGALPRRGHGGRAPAHILRFSIPLLTAVPISIIL